MYSPDDGFKPTRNASQIVTVLTTRCRKVSRHKNGPAHTLYIKRENFRIDVDLVPVVEFSSTTIPPSPVRWMPDMAAPWVVVPKPMEDKKLWRLSFPKQEQQLMHAQLHLKYINRILKKFRDANSLNIPSYHIKTLFLWEAYEQKQKHNQAFWQKSPSYLFPYMLAKLADALEKRCIKFFWEKDMNLLKTFHDSTLGNLEGRVKRILSKLNRIIETNNIDELKDFLFRIFDVPESSNESELLNAGMANLDINTAACQASEERSWCTLS